MRVVICEFICLLLISVLSLTFSIFIMNSVYISSIYAKSTEDSNVDDIYINDEKTVEYENLTEIDLESIINEAINNNPEILAAGHRWEAAKKRIKKVKSLDDPTLKFGKTNAPGNPFNIGKEAVESAPIMSPATIALSQKIPFPGKLKLRGKVALEAAEMKKKVMEGKVQAIIAEVKLAYYDLYFLHKSIEINEENRELLQKFTKIAESMYSVGKVSQRDVLAAMVELSKIVNEITVLEQEKKSSEARLNNLLNRSQDVQLGKPKDFKKHRMLFKFNELEEIALKNRPMLMESEQAVKKEKLNFELTKKDYFSDFTAMIEYRLIDSFPSDTWSSSLSINIPWLWSKQRYKVKEAKEELKGAIADNEAINNRTLFELRALISMLISTESTVNLFNTSVIPQAEQSLNATRIGYETGNVDFLTLIDSQRTLLDAKLQYYKALTEHEQNIARMEKTVGVELTN